MQSIEREDKTMGEMAVSKWAVEMAKTLLENYDKQMANKAEHIADMMADWIGSSETEAKRYADQYATVRVERQRIRDVLLSLQTCLDFANKTE